MRRTAALSVLLTTVAACGGQAATHPDASRAARTAAPRTRALVVVPPPGTCHFRAAGALPDRRCGPGNVNTDVRQSTIRTTICKSGWTATVRNVLTSTKTAMYAAYGVTGPHPFPEWEMDHIIPLELGGSNDPKNLFPEHHPLEKDRVENDLNHKVCQGRMTLSAARSLIRTDWRRDLAAAQAAGVSAHQNRHEHGL